MLKQFATKARTKLIAQISARLTFVLKEETAELKAKAPQIKKLREEIAKSTQQQVIETVAYTWFNRFVALRFMDVNGYTTPRVLTPEDGHTVPTILQDAKSGIFSDDINVDRDRVLKLLDGKIQHSNPQGEAYRMLIVASCNALGKSMPFLFETIEDWTELLIPEDLLSDSSIIADVRNGMAPEDCQQEEVIGWLYQYYISEKKDQVFEALKKNQKITAENIPAATQLFTPHWIVRYLVENSLGKMWLQLKPGSGLRAHMPYYIEQEPSGDLPDGIKGIKDITFLDPCTGSGHMLVYAFELFCRMYEEEGFDTHEIPALILQNNLFGLEIDDRAASLAGFALCMKSRAIDKRFFKRAVLPKVRAFQNITFEKGEIDRYMARVGIDVFTADIATNITMLSQAKNFGSLIRPVPIDLDYVNKSLYQANVEGDVFLSETHRKVVDGLDMIGSLQRKYACVVTNPPYMGNAGFNPEMTEFTRVAYPNSKSDLMTCFMERNLELSLSKGYMAMINLPSWMFLYSFEVLRKHLLKTSTIESLIHNGRGVFGSDFGSVSFVIKNVYNQNYIGLYRRLFIENVKVDNVEIKEQRFLNPLYGAFSVCAKDFDKIPGSPLSYWINKTVFKCFEHDKTSKHLDVYAGLTTGNTDIFLRYWQEVPFDKISFTTSGIPEKQTFVPYNKGGIFRKWYGNLEYILAYSIVSLEKMKLQKGFRPDGLKYFFQQSITWSKITISLFSARYSSSQNAFDATATSAFGEIQNLEKVILILNSKIGNYLLNVLNSTMVYLPRDIKNFPVIHDLWNSDFNFQTRFTEILTLAKNDWDLYESSRDFLFNPLIDFKLKKNLISSTYYEIMQKWINNSAKLCCLEQENNRIFIKAYGLETELTPEVPLHEITLTCNPAYRYGKGKTDEEYATLQKADTMRELLSYCVGVLFGRYSLDKPGLVLANAGEAVSDYVNKVFGENATVPADAILPDEDAIIPILDDEYFSDDIINRTNEFLSKAFSPEALTENIKFIEDALGKDLRKFYTKDFYTDHIKRYKKRPIYWMFASPKGTFRALIYMHRYRSDTLSQMLSNYLRPLIEKLKEEQVMRNRELVSESISPSDKIRAQKRLDKIIPQIEELTDYEQVLYRLAAKRIEIDLDDGVKVNYVKFTGAIVPIKGLESEE